MTVAYPAPIPAAGPPDEPYSATQVDRLLRNIVAKMGEAALTEARANITEGLNRGDYSDTGRMLGRLAIIDNELEHRKLNPRKLPS